MKATHYLINGSQEEYTGRFRHYYNLLELYVSFSDTSITYVIIPHPLLNVINRNYTVLKAAKRSTLLVTKEYCSRNTAGTFKQSSNKINYYCFTKGKDNKSFVDTLLVYMYMQYEKEWIKEYGDSVEVDPDEQWAWKDRQSEDAAGDERDQKEHSKSLDERKLCLANSTLIQTMSSLLRHLLGDIAALKFV
jgi:hypothetical protein